MARRRRSLALPHRVGRARPKETSMPPQPEKWLDIRLFGGRLAANAQGELQVPRATLSLKPGKGSVRVEEIETRAVVAGDIPPETARLIQQALHNVYRWPGVPQPTALLAEQSSVELVARSITLGSLSSPV